MTFKSDHFILQEFVPKDIYDQWGEKSMWFIDQRIVELADGLREYFGKQITINNWHTGGHFNYRGYRDPECTQGAKQSQHRFGRGMDFNVQGMTSDEVYDAIMEHEKAFMAMGITTMENKLHTVGWTHVDIRNHGMDQILIVNP